MVAFEFQLKENWIPLKAKSINRHLRKWERKKLGAGVWGQPASQEQVHKSKWLIFCHSMSDSLTTMCHGPYKSSFAVTAAKKPNRPFIPGLRNQEWLRTCWSRVPFETQAVGLPYIALESIGFVEPNLRPEAWGDNHLFLIIVCSPLYWNTILEITAALAQSAVLTTNRCQDGHIDLLMKKITGLVSVAVVCKCSVLISALSHTHLRIWRWK